MDRFKYAVPVVITAVWVLIALARLNATLVIVFGVCALVAEITLMALCGKRTSSSRDIPLGISHDMRTPLSVLKSYINYRSGKGDAEEDEYRRAAESSVNKLLGIADRLSSKANNG